MAIVVTPSTVGLPASTTATDFCCQVAITNQCIYQQMYLYNAIRKKYKLLHVLALCFHPLGVTEQRNISPKC